MNTGDESRDALEPAEGLKEVYDRLEVLEAEALRPLPDWSQIASDASALAAIARARGAARA